MAGGVVDVVVIGAGFAGLTAARELAKRGNSFVVLEARDRVGGRVYSKQIGSHTFDLGGQWIGPTQNHLAALAKELGVQTFPQYHAGSKLLSWGGKIQRYNGELPRLPILSMIDLLRMQRSFNKLVAQIPPDAPWKMPNADKLDSMTLESWKEQFLWSSGSKLFVDIITRAVLTSEPRDVSFLFFLSYLKWGHGLDTLISIPKGAQQDRFIGGVQQMPEKLAKMLEPHVILGAPVRTIMQSAEGVTVISEKGTWNAERVIVAIPPVLSGHIHYDPPVSAARDALCSRMPMGSVIKYVATYERAFWRDAGFSGEAFSDTGPTVTTFDDTSHDGGAPALVSFSDGAAARQWSPASPAERQRAVLSEFARFFGPKALHPTHFEEKDWNTDPWSKGCYVGVMTPGTMTSFGHALREPCGRIHWSGTETATEWMGYIDGAIQSGLRAAAEVADRLSSGRGT